MSQSHYNKKHKNLARKLRKDGTIGQTILWNEVLRAKQFHGYSHNFKYEEDKLRDQKLQKLGYTIVRFTEKDVRNDINNVIRVLESYLPDK